MNSQELPHNDKDLQLARRIGELLDSGTLGSESIGQDEFESLLDQFKQSQSPQAVKTSPEVSEKMWQAIAAVTEPDTTQEKPAAKIFTLNPFIGRIAIAASILFAIVIGWYIMRPAPAPVLVAEAGNAPFLYVTDDGSQISLRSHSSLYVLREASGHVEYQLEGEARFVVTNNASRTFSVDAGSARISVLGTTFNIVHRDTLVSVYLEEGSIELEHLVRKQSQILSPGQAGSLSALTDITIDQAPQVEEFMDWLDNELIFESKQLREIVEELEFHFAVTIEIPEEIKEENAKRFLISNFYRCSP